MIESPHFQVDAFTVATGPVHHDLPIRIASEFDARVQFDIRMSQVCELSITPMEVSL